MDRNETIKELRNQRELHKDNFRLYEALNEAIYAIDRIERLKKERDAALDTAYAALKIMQENKA